MITVVKQHTNDNYYISLEITEDNGIPHHLVKVHPIVGGQCGHPVKQISYGIRDRKSAHAAFRRYMKKYV